MHEKWIQNHEKVRFGESQRLLGGVLEPFWPPRVPQGRKIYKKGIVLSSGTKLGAFWDVFSIIFSFIFLFVFKSIFLVFGFHFGSILVPCLEIFGALGPIFCAKADFTKTFKRLWVFISCCWSRPSNMRRFFVIFVVFSASRLKIDCCIDFGYILAPFWLHFGNQVGSQINEKSTRTNVWKTVLQVSLSKPAPGGVPLNQSIQGSRQLTWTL